MVLFLVGLHALLGEAGGMLFVWVFIELLNPTASRLGRAWIVALWGVILLFLSWLVGGFYYVEFYGSQVKPVIKGGPMPWAHSVVIETKEHVFLLLPFLALAAYSLISHQKLLLVDDKKMRTAVLVLVGLVVAITFLMAGMGFLVSSGFRSALETMSL